ncbi:unnamed protein product, partial [Hymenolepis diminuta]
HVKNLPLYVQPILASALKTKPTESVAEVTDSIIENHGSPRIDEIPPTPNPSHSKNEPMAAWRSEYWD